MPYDNTYTIIEFKRDIEASVMNAIDHTLPRVVQYFHTRWLHSLTLLTQVWSQTANTIILVLMCVIPVVCVTNKRG